MVVRTVPLSDPRPLAAPPETGRNASDCSIAYSTLSSMPSAASACFIILSFVSAVSSQRFGKSPSDRTASDFGLFVTAPKKDLLWLKICAMGKPAAQTRAGNVPHKAVGQCPAAKNEPRLLLEPQPRPQPQPQLQLRPQQETPTKPAGW